MALDYFLLVFIASFGVYQIASSHAKLKGLWFFRHPKVQYIFGVLVILGAFAWFYTDENRNWQHTVEGAQQLLLFLAAILLAYVITAILASIIQARAIFRRENPTMGKQYEKGMETLKTTTVFGGILSSLRKQRDDED